MKYTKHAKGDLNRDIPRGSPLQSTLSVQQEHFDQERSNGRQIIVTPLLWLYNIFPRNAYKENALKLNFNFVWKFAVEGWSSTVMFYNQWSSDCILQLLKLFSTIECLHISIGIFFLERKKYDIDLSSFNCFSEYM